MPGLQVTNETDIKIEDKEITLAGICYSITGENGGIISSMSEEFYNDPANHLADLTDNNVVYIIKCQFSTTNPHP